jgi:hypothetical protein
MDYEFVGYLTTLFQLLGFCNAIRDGKIIIIIIISYTYFCVFLYSRANFVIGLCAVKFARK